MFQKRTAVTISLLMLIAVMAGACSMNRQLPAELDEAAIEGDVRAAIATAVPGKTFALEVSVQNGSVKLSGHVDSASDRDAIITRVRQVNGVRSVDASQLHVK